MCSAMFSPLSPIQVLRVLPKPWKAGVLAHSSLMAAESRRHGAAAQGSRVGTGTQTLLFHSISLKHGQSVLRVIEHP